MKFAWLLRYNGQILSVFRVVIGLLFLEHGLSKLFGFPVPMPMPHLPPLLLAAGIIETVGGALIAAGFMTRLAAFICSGEMAVAYFLMHIERGFFPLENGGEAVILFCFGFLAIAALGPGVWAVDSEARTA
ncbi:MAG: DoxX family protein [Hyphomicrobiales bacterium]|nr:DoxX family protein [Hyphomicrobiales bacterium]MDE2017389.1 DoxX family protein [Hyphomicrobiales bacterium]